MSKWHSARLLPNPYVKYMQLALIEGMELRALSIYYRIMSYNHTPCLFSKTSLINIELIIFKSSIDIFNINNVNILSNINNKYIHKQIAIP